MRRPFDEINHIQMYITSVWHRRSLMSPLFDTEDHLCRLCLTQKITYVASVWHRRSLSSPLFDTEDHLCRLFDTEDHLCRLCLTQKITYVACLTQTITYVASVWHNILLISPDKINRLCHRSVHLFLFYIFDTRPNMLSRITKST
jgi:hypothetical protein